jgi:hypothetical protein
MGHLESGVALALLLCFATPARADLISGHVYDPGGRLLPNQTFTVEAGGHRVAQFRTDASGNFSVYLDPGSYTVRSSDNSLEGQVTSYSQPVQQDIHLNWTKR